MPPNPPMPGWPKPPPIALPWRVPPPWKDDDPIPSPTPCEAEDIEPSPPKWVEPKCAAPAEEEGGSATCRGAGEGVACEAGCVTDPAPSDRPLGTPARCARASGACGVEACAGSLADEVRCGVERAGWEEDGVAAWPPCDVRPRSLDGDGDSGGESCFSTPASAARFRAASASVTGFGGADGFDGVAGVDVW